MQPKAITRFLFPSSLVVLHLALFCTGSFSYQLISDDHFFLAQAAEKSIPEAVGYFSEALNGRFASHCMVATLFSVIAEYPGLIPFYHLLLLSLFILALAALLGSYLSLFRNSNSSTGRILFYASFITAFFFFFFFDGRTEVWYWLSSTAVHLISLIIAMTAFSLLLSRNNSLLRTGLAALLLFLAGGLSETYAIMYALLLLFLIYIKEKKSVNLNRGRILIALIALLTGIALNLFFPGTNNRLQTLPAFDLLQALKNTLHSLALPFLRVQYLPLKISLLILLLWHAGRLAKISFQFKKQFLRVGLLTLLFITTSFFLPCYILSDIVADRMASLGYLAGILFLFDQLIFRQEKSHGLHEFPRII